MLRTNTKKVATVLFVTLLFCMPFVVHAQSTGITSECTSGGSARPGDCTFQELINAIQNVVTWGRNFALMFSVVVLAYAGFKFMISGDYPAERTKAREMLRKVAVGIVLIMAAWFIVSLILKALGVNSPIQFN